MPKGAYEGELGTLFYNVANLGAATVRAPILMLWTGWEKQVPGFWAEIKERYEAALAPSEVEHGWRLWRWQYQDHITLIAMDPETAEKKERWWSDVKELAVAPSPGRRKIS